MLSYYIVTLLAIRYIIITNISTNNNYINGIGL